MTICPDVTATFDVTEHFSKRFFKFQQGNVFVFELIIENKTNFL